MRKTVCFTLFLVLTVLFILPAGAAAKEPVFLYVDGSETAAETPAFYDGEITWAPLRAVAEALGGSVTWDAETATAAVNAPGLALTVHDGDGYCVANGRCLYIGALRWQNERILVPVRVLCRAFGASAAWDGETRAVFITGGGEPIASGDVFYADSDVYWLSRIINAEARGESLEGQIAVGNVVLNRVASEEFPDSIKAVIFDRRCGIQFSPAYSGSLYNKPSASCVAAAKIALEGTSVVGDSLYFSPSSRAATCWASRNCDFVTQIGGHVFFA